MILDLSEVNFSELCSPNNRTAFKKVFPAI